MYDLNGRMETIFWSPVCKKRSPRKHAIFDDSNSILAIGHKFA